MSDKQAIAENIDRIKSSLPQGVTLVAVSKTKPVEDIKFAYDQGIRDFGENKVQEFLVKYDELPKDIRWHLIGHLQRNKVASIVDKVHLIHGIDSMRLLREINKRAIEKNVVVDGLLQIHIAQEESKFGFDYDEIDSLISEGLFSDHENVRIRGLMGMASNVSDKQQIDDEFSRLHDLFKTIKTDHPALQFDTLSMGMSGDYPRAIKAGSTMIRVGSALFGQRNYR